MDFSKLTKRKDALELLYSHWQPAPKEESIATIEAEGRILTEDQYSRYSFPVVRASAMDGIAVNYDSFASGVPDMSGWQEGKEYVRADTGDDFDDAYDTVIPVEWIEFLSGGGLRFIARETVERDMHVRGKGSMLQEDALLVEKGTRLGARHLALLASGGIAEIPVVVRPKVGFIPTGSELIPLGEEPQRGNNIDSNSILARGMLSEMGAEPVCYPIVKDRKEELGMMLDRALTECDIVIINAGSSKGKEDFNTQILREKGDLLFHGVAAVPGRPMSISIIGGKAVVNLAGPSVAAFYGLDWLIRDMVCRWIGSAPQQRNALDAILAEDMPSPPPLEMLKFVELIKDEDGYKARPYERGETGRRLPPMATDGIFVTELGKKGYKKGEKIRVELLK